MFQTTNQGKMAWQGIDSSKVKFANNGSPGPRIEDAKLTLGNVSSWVQGDLNMA